MMRVVLLLVMVLLAPSAVDAGKPGAVWRSKTVLVRAYIGEAWTPYVTQGIADINAILPPRAPHLTLKLLAPISCKRAQKKNAKKRRTIIVCENPDMPPPRDGSTQGRAANGVITSPVRITFGVLLTEYPELGALEAQNTVCHELMHAVAWAPENLGDESCVSGRTTFNTKPGADDIAFLNRVYRKR